MIGNDRQLAGSLLAVIVLLIAFGSLYPFSFSLTGGDPVARIGELLEAGTTRSDVAANVLLYLPLGACLAWLFAARLAAPAAALAATLAAAALSLAIELAQLYETRRVASLADVACNAAGALLGGALALAIARERGRLQASPFAALLGRPVAAALVLSWIGYRLAPFAPAEPADWASHFAPLAASGWPAPVDAATHLVAWLALLIAAGRIVPGRAAAFTAGAMAAVLAGRVLFEGLALDAAEFIGMAAALASAPALASLPPARAAALAAAALLALVAWKGLAPFDFQLAQDRFALLPFGESLTQYRATNLADMFLRCFTNGALVWLLVQAGLSTFAATGAGAGAVFAIELLQTWLPGQTAEITEPLLAVCAGGLIAVFERDGEAA